MKPFLRQSAIMHNQLMFCIFGMFYVTNVNYWDVGILIKRVTVYPIYMIMGLIFLTYIIKIKNNKKCIPIATFNILLFLLFFGIICSVRGLSSNINVETIRFLLSTVTGSFITWIMPVILLHSSDKQTWLFFLKNIKPLVIIGTLYVVFIMTISFKSGNYPEHYMYNSVDFLFLSPLLVVISIYTVDRIGIVIGFTSTFILLIHMFLAGERFAIAFVGIICILYVFNTLIESSSSKVKVFAASILLITTVSTYFFISNTQLFNKYIYRNFEQGEMFIDSRGTLGEDSTRNMTTFEYFFGKGTNGRYIALFNNAGRIIGRDRINIEIGYKQILLKGGWLMLFCFLYISIRAVFLGIFRTKNKITKYLAYIVLSRLIVMSTAMIPRVGFEYLMYWVIVGGCLSYQVRGMNDNTLKEYFSRKRNVFKRKICSNYQLNFSQKK